MLRCPALSLLVALLFAPLSYAQAAPADGSMPHLVDDHGRYALMVSGAPYLMLGGQINNSSTWPSQMPKVWSAVDAMHLNTVEAPIYWEQLEPMPGAYNYSAVDMLLAGAREHHVHLVVLWFGTWKNGSPGYTPAWVKLDHTRFPYLVGKDGKRYFSMPPYNQALLELDKAAFVALMRHLKQADPQHTVLMVQVENESGVWGAARDYSAATEKLFAQPVPAPVLKAMNKTEAGTWSEVFGEDADEYFHAYSIATYINEIAAAGKRAYPLPLYVNAALRSPLHPSRPPSFESGGPTDDVLPLWKAAAPAIDIVAPDIYLGDYPSYTRVLELYHRPDNALFVPETGNGEAFARYFFAAVGAQAIGWSPFGIDRTWRLPEDSERVDGDAPSPVALNYQIVGPMQREIAALSFAGKVRGSSEDPLTHTQQLQFAPEGGVPARWEAVVSYGQGASYSSRPAPGNEKPIGGALVAQLGPDEFLVTAVHARVDFAPVTTLTGTEKPQRLWALVEEGSYLDGKWQTTRIWNGDQTDYGLNFRDRVQVLRVRLSTF
ncbi:MAG TPA: DUF5597 domain-containing protein [Acidobacteriaceae bacterium]